MDLPCIARLQMVLLISRGATTNLNQGGGDALVCRNPTPLSRLGSRVVPTVPPLEG
jgi:hypothetical protein